MAVTYEWSIETIDVIRQHNDHENVVTKVVWKCTAVDGEHTKSMIGVQNLPVNNIGPGFTPYEDVTADQILEWTKVFLNVPAIEAGLIPNTFTRSFTSDDNGGIPPPKSPDPDPIPAQEEPNSGVPVDENPPAPTVG